MSRLVKFFTLLAVVFLVSFTPKKEAKLIVLDVGHGGNDSGLVVQGKQEKKIVMDIASTIKQLNKDDNIKIILTRYNDSYVTLQERVSVINNLQPDFVISLHINDSNEEEVNMFVSKQSKNSTQAKAMMNKLVSYYPEQLTSVSLKTANFYLLKNIQSPSVMLEFGYVYGQENQKEIAKMILNSLE